MAENKEIRKTNGATRLYVNGNAIRVCVCVEGWQDDTGNLPKFKSTPFGIRLYVIAVVLHGANLYNVIKIRAFAKKTSP